MDKPISRRKVLKGGLAASAFTIIPSHVLSQGTNKTKAAFPERKPLPPSEQLNIGFVGVGGKGHANISGCLGHNIYSLCDVDSTRGAKAFGHFDKANHYDDWRVMLDKDGDALDAVVVTTPDHNHAVITMGAMQLGKAVYTEKPLTRTISEARILTEYANKNKIVTQMGNQGHSNHQARTAVEWIRSGLLGDIREVHCWTNRPIWPQGIMRPEAEPVPDTINWDVWLGPAEKKPYSSKIAPFNWRAFWDYGAGALGDMAAHIIDHPIWALELGSPEIVEVEFERENPASAKDSFPKITMVTYRFAARGGRPPVTLKWYDGKENLPPRPAGLEDNRNLDSQGLIYVGEKYSMIQGVYGASPRIFPDTDRQIIMPELKAVPHSLPRTKNHYEEWFTAIKANDPSLAMAGFDYSGPLTETMLLGCVATRVGPGTKLSWDAENMTTGNAEADQFVHHQYRKGWSL